MLVYVKEYHSHSMVRKKHRLSTISGKILKILKHQQLSFQSLLVLIKKACNPTTNNCSTQDSNVDARTLPIVKSILHENESIGTLVREEENKAHEGAVLFWMFSGCYFGCYFGCFLDVILGVILDVFWMFLDVFWRYFGCYFVCFLNVIMDVILDDILNDILDVFFCMLLDVFFMSFRMIF